MSTLLNHHPDSHYCHFRKKENKIIHSFSDDHEDVLGSGSKTHLLHAEWNRHTDKHAVDAWKLPDVKCLDKTFREVVVIMHQPVRGGRLVFEGGFTGSPTSISNKPQHFTGRQNVLVKSALRECDLRSIHIYTYIITMTTLRLKKKQEPKNRIIPR